MCAMDDLFVGRPVDVFSFKPNMPSMPEYSGEAIGICGGNVLVEKDGGCIESVPPDLIRFTDNRWITIPYDHSPSKKMMDDTLGGQGENLSKALECMWNKMEEELRASLPKWVVDLVMKIKKEEKTPPPISDAGEGIKSR